MNTRQEDYYAKLAKEKGYQARSVFKLEEIQQRFQMIKKGSKVLDIGASPGSWSYYTIDKLKAHVVGIDLKPVNMPIKDPALFSFILGDIFDDNIKDEILKHGPFDTVMSDAAPSTTGSRALDTIRSFQIAERVIELALISLKAGGDLLIKVFQGGEEKDLLDRLRNHFEKVRTFKPKASRKESFETYILAKGYKAQ